ncbi:MAG: hypothetical protein R3E84_22535 [Pseudomonadales bacterium]
MSRGRLHTRWLRLCLKLGRLPVVGRAARRLAMRGFKPYTGAVPLARLLPDGFVSPDARVHVDIFERGRNCFVGDGVLLMNEQGGGGIHLGNGVKVLEHSTLLTSEGGSIHIGDHTSIQPRCQFSAVKGSIRIGSRVEIAPACAFYPYNHGMAPDMPIQKQPLTSKGDIEVGDEAWLGYGVILLDGARVGRGAVVAAGAVVTSEIPDMAIAVGTPAKVIAYRDREIQANDSRE